MGFTVEDMLLVSRQRYQMKLIAGKGGWSNSISWLLMVEDLTIVQRFSGKELAVTTCLGFQEEEKLHLLMEELVRRQASGLIINTGCYIREVPAGIRKFADDNALPLLTVPWDIEIAEMIKDLSIRIFLQGSTDEQLSAAFIKAIESPEDYEAYVKTLLPHFDIEGSFQVILLHRNGLAEMDTRLPPAACPDEPHAQRSFFLLRFELCRHHQCAESLHHCRNSPAVPCQHCPENPRPVLRDRGRQRADRHPLPPPLLSPGEGCRQDGRSLSNG